MSLAGFNALVTGAGGGIGGACAAALASAGARVVVVSRRSVTAEETLAGIRERGGDGIVIQCDCGKPDEVRAMVATAEEQLGGIDILVSTVALEEHGGLFDADEASILRSFEGTVVAAFALCQAAAAAMVAAGRPGKIVLISSPHAIRPFRGALAYNLAEAALRQLGLTMAHELAEHRISVNLVEPGWIDTPGERKFYSEEFLEQSAKLLPWGRRGLADEIAAAVGYLVSPAADYVSGTTVRVDGAMGVSMARLPGLEA